MKNPLILLATALLGLSTTAADCDALAQGVPRTATEVRRIVSNDASPATSLTYISSLVVTPEGVVYAGHSLENVIRVFDATGKLLRTIGRKGQGPGEFSGSIPDMGLFGDTLWVRDNDGRRINFYSRDGKPVGEIDIPSARSGRCNGTLAFLRSKLFVLRCSYIGARNGDSTVFVLANAKGVERLKVFKEPRPDNTVLNINTGSATLSTGQPFGPYSLDAYSPNASLSIVAAPASLWNGQPGQVRLAIVNAAGTLKNVDVSYTPRRFTDVDADTTIANRSRRMAAGGAARGFQLAPIEKSWRDGLYKPDYFSELGGLVTGDDGSIWISPPYDPSLWRVHSADGKLEFTVRVEKGLQMLLVSRDAFWAVRSDANDIPMIVQFRVLAQ